MIIENLLWDSEFFDKKIGRVKIIDNEIVDIALLTSEAGKIGYNLLYIFSDSELNIVNSVSSANQPELVDKKVVYQQFVNAENWINLLSENLLPEYLSSTVSDDLVHLAYLSGTFSRFAMPKYFKQEDFQRLYKTWIAKSVSKEIADCIYVAQENNKNVGMLTLKVEQGVGHIGLLAVDSKTQAKGYGTKLISTCIQSLLEKGIKQIEVPTQMANKQACRFYAKCGFSVKSITYIYHLIIE